MVDLKIFIGLSMPNQYCQSKYQGSFGVMFWDKKFQTFIFCISKIVIDVGKK